MTKDTKGKTSFLLSPEFTEAFLRLEPEKKIEYEAALLNCTDEAQRDAVESKFWTKVIAVRLYLGKIIKADTQHFNLCGIIGNPR